jgi:hypothetical protein
MERFRQFISILFPVRTHIYEEIDYLRAQLAQKQRRIDELQEALIELKRPTPKVQLEQKPDGKMVPIQPRGIEAYRAARRANPPQETDPVEGPYKTVAQEAINAVSR